MNNIMRSTIPKEYYPACHLFDSTGDETFISIAYRALLCREPDQEGISYYIQRLSANLTRLAFLKEITTSKEAQDITNPMLATSDELFINLTYRLHLLRHPDVQGFEYYHGRIQQGENRATIYNEISNSSEAKSNKYSKIRSGLLFIARAHSNPVTRLPFLRSLFQHQLILEIQICALKHASNDDLRKIQLEIKHLIENLSSPKNSLLVSKQGTKQLAETTEHTAVITSNYIADTTLYPNEPNQNTELIKSATTDIITNWLTVANKSTDVVIIPCAFAFEPLYNQRPINAAKYYASRGYVVIFVAWQWAQDDVIRHGESKVAEGIYQVPLYRFLAGINDLTIAKSESSLILLTLPAPILLDALPILRARRYNIVYDILDDWEAFHGVGQAPWYIKSREEETVLTADLVTAVSPPLSIKFQKLRTQVYVLPNGFDPELLASGPITNSPPSVRENIAGYFGHLTEAWFDWELLFQLASAFPHIRFEIIGYGASSSKIEEASQFRNISLLGKIDTAELHRFAQRWSVGLIPFKEGRLAAAVDPIKIYEYIFFGLKVVISGIPHLADYPNSFMLKPNDPCQDFQIALNAPLSPSTETTDFLSRSTWSERFRLMESLTRENNYLQGLYHE